MPRALFRLSLLLLLWPGTAAIAADVGIAAFQGVWRGNAVSESEISVNFELTSRDIDVTVRADAGVVSLLSGIRCNGKRAIPTIPGKY